MSTTRKPRRWVKTFRPEFAPIVEAGTKCQTIRPWPKRWKHIPQVGDILDARTWTGLPYRSPMRKLREGQVTDVRGIHITTDGIAMLRQTIDLDAFARADGFRDWPHMREWFAAQHGLPFTGMLVRWEVSP